MTSALLRAAPARTQSGSRSGISPQIEHRLFSYISKNWRGRALASYEVIINSIAATSTTTGLEVFARLDDSEYPKVKVTDDQLAAVNLTRDQFHPEWNYSISPSTK